MKASNTWKENSDIERAAAVSSMRPMVRPPRNSDDVEKFRAQRRQDYAKRHRQQDIAVGLRQCESHRETATPPAAQAENSAFTCLATRAEV